MVIEYEFQLQYVLHFSRTEGRHGNRWEFSGVPVTDQPTKVFTSNFLRQKVNNALFHLLLGIFSTLWTDSERKSCSKQSWTRGVQIHCQHCGCSFPRWRRPVLIPMHRNLVLETKGFLTQVGLRLPSEYSLPVSRRFCQTVPWRIWLSLVLWFEKLGRGTHPCRPGIAPGHLQQSIFFSPQQQRRSK